MKAIGICSLFLGIGGAFAVLASFAGTQPGHDQELASIRGGHVVFYDPGDPEPAIKKCLSSNDTCTTLFNANSSCFGKTWNQPSACPPTQTCIPTGKYCTNHALLKRCIGVPVEECNEAAVAVTCGVVNKADIGACAVTGQGPFVDANGNTYFTCSTVAGQCARAGGPTDIPCPDKTECQ